MPDAAAQTGAVTLVHCIAERMDRLLETTMPLRRPPVAGGGACGPERSGQLRYALKTPHRDGTTHIVLEPLDLVARLATLVPPPRRHLTRRHGAFAPHRGLR